MTPEEQVAAVVALLDAWVASPTACTTSVVAREVRAALADPASVLAVRDAAIRAEALNEAADAEEARCTGDWNGIVCDSCRESAKRLRTRARAEAVRSS